MQNKYKVKIKLFFSYVCVVFVWCMHMCAHVHVCAWPYPFDVGAIDLNPDPHTSAASPPAEQSLQAIHI